MRAIEAKFRALKRRGEGALIAYVTCGDPSLNHTPRIVDALFEGGVDMLELGIPFSDPIADGPTIQRASVRALKSGVRPVDVLETAGKIHGKYGYRLPIIILTYYNIIYRIGVEKFFNLAAEKGVSGVIVPDLPVEEASEYKAAAENHDVDTIFLASPSTSDERLEKIIRYSSGFLYLVSVYGVTGARTRLRRESIMFIRRASSISNGRIPLAVGFGISKPSHVREALANGADGVIVGSMLINIIEQNLNDKNQMLTKLKSYTQKLKNAAKPIRRSKPH